MSLFRHGIARPKEDFGGLINTLFYEITAYLPEDNIFAVAGPTWLTLNWSEEEFLEKFEYLSEQDIIDQNIQINT